MLTQLLVVTQSALVEQVVRQVGVVVLHRYGSQSELVTDRQTPAPSQVRCGVSVDPTQVAPAHCVPVAQNRHAPAPLHMPSVPHVVDTVVAHCEAGVGAVPLATLLHVPRLPAIAHDLHVPVHAAAQHAPCAQMPELHSALAPQLAPSGFLPQLPATQVFGIVQSASAAQVVLHCPLGAHWNGVQGRLAPPEQVPAPSQRPAVISVKPMQPAGVQIVPAG